MNWLILPDGRKCLPEGTILKFEYQGGCYKILGTPVGYGGAGVIYPAARVVKKNDRWEAEDMWVALKECYPQSTDGMLDRNETGTICCISDHDSYTADYYQYAKEMMRREKGITGQVFNRGFRLTPVWDIVEQEEISFDGEEFYPAENQYGIMERLDEKGTSLGGILKKQPGGCLTAYQSVCVLTQILKAVEEVHQAGFLHGDIQENNIFLKGTRFEQEEEGMVTLIDFGSARRLLEDGATAVIWDKKLYSTSGYSAPECISGNDGTLRLTRAADIYSVGYLMLRMMTGRTMDARTLQLVVNGKYLYPRQARKIGCPSGSIDAVNRILQKALQQRPEDRYPDAGSMLEDIRRLERALAPPKSTIASVDYEAFISYCHEETSIKAAERIQKLIEHYKIPKTVRRQSGKEKMGKIFRDREELASSSDMEVHLKEALDHSEYLIVLLSPRVPESPWVNREIELFLQSHDRDHILTVLVDGELQESFPEILRKDEKFDSGQMKLRPVESLAADIRGADSKEQRQKLKTEIYRLLAPMLGCSFDDLRQRQKEYQFRRIMRFTTAAMVVFGITAGYMSWQAFQIHENYQETLRKQSRYLAQISQELLVSGDREKAIEVALEALPDSEADNSRPKVAEAEAALAQALYTYQGFGYVTWFLNTDYQLEMDTKSAELETLSEDGSLLLAADTQDTVYIWDTDTGELRQKWNRRFWETQEMDTEVIYADFLDESRVLIVTRAEQVQIAVSDGTVLQKYGFAEEVEEFKGYDEEYTWCALSEDGAYLAVYDYLGDGNLYKYRVSDGKMLYMTQIDDAVTEKMQNENLMAGIRFSPDGSRGGIIFNSVWFPVAEEYEKGMLLLVDTEQKRTETVTSADYGFHELTFTQDGRVVVFGYDPDVDSYPYEVEGKGYVGCYELDGLEGVWQKDLTFQFEPYGDADLIYDQRTGETILWCNRQILFLDGETGETLKSCICDERIAGICYRGENNYLIGMQDGSMHLITVEGEGFWDLGTNVTKETSGFLYHSEKDTAFLLSEEGTITCMKNQVDEGKQTVELENEIFGISTYHGVPVYATGEYADEEGWQYRLNFFDSDTHEKKFSLVTDGIVQSELWLEDKRTFCYVEYVSGGEVRITAYDSEQEQVLWQHVVECDDEDITFAVTSAGEQLAMCGNYNASSLEESRICFLDLAADEWKEEVTVPRTDWGKDGYWSYKSYLSKDGTYIVTVENFHAYTGSLEAAVHIYDRQKGCWLELPEEIQELSIECSYSDMVYMAQEKNLAAVYEAGRSQLVILDLEKNKILQRIPFVAGEQRQLTFLPDDSGILLWGDDGYLKLWSIEDACITMEDTQKLYQMTSLMAHGENDFIEIRCLDEETVNLYAGGTWMKWFYLLEDGRFYPYVKSWNSFYDADTSRIGSIDLYKKKLYWYDRYSFDELLKLAEDVNGEYELSDADKVKYFIE